MENDNNILKDYLIKGSLTYTDVFPKRDMFRELAKQFNGKFSISHNSGKELETLRVRIPYGNCNINISASDTRPLKFEIDFIPLKEFEVTISWEDFIERILKIFGSAEVELGFKDFDDKYLIKSNDAYYVEKIFTRDIQIEILKFNIFSISYSKSGKESSKLISVIQRQIGNFNELVEQVKLFQKIADKMVNLKLVK